VSDYLTASDHQNGLAKYAHIVQRIAVHRDEIARVVAARMAWSGGRPTSARALNSSPFLPCGTTVASVPRTIGTPAFTASATAANVRVFAFGRTCARASLASFTNVPKVWRQIPFSGPSRGREDDPRGVEANRRVGVRAEVAHAGETGGGRRAGRVAARRAAPDEMHVRIDEAGEERVDMERAGRRAAAAHVHDAIAFDGDDRVLDVASRVDVEHPVRGDHQPVRARRGARGQQQQR
jgi:hypothetical protein